ncbi:MAG: hypothetical protein ABEL76_13325 [Bradymonadaceae bacterium]
MFDIIAEQLGFGVLLPAVVAGTLLAAVWFSRIGREVLGGEWASPLALGLATVAAFWGINGRPESYPTVAAAAIVLGLIETVLSERRELHWILRFGLFAALPFFLVGFMYEHHWSGRAAAGWTVGFLGVSLAATGVLDRVDRIRSGMTLPVALTVLATGASIGLLSAGTARVASVAGGLAAACGAAAVVAWWRGDFSFGTGGATCFVGLYTPLLLYGYFSISDPPLTSGIVLASAPQVLWLVVLTPLSRVEGWKSVVVDAMLTAIPAGVAVWLTL